MEKRWKNKQRTLVVCSRGIIHQHRHLINELVQLMPHSKKVAKISNKDPYLMIKDLCEAHNCNNYLFIEGRKKYSFLWMGQFPEGPTCKFLLSHVHSTSELNFTGNCLQGSRPLISFDESFDQISYLRLIKLIIVKTIGTPRYHTKSKPFIDHVFGFTQVQNQIFFRNYQLPGDELVEIGPRFMIIPLEIMDGVFEGDTLYENQSYSIPEESQVLEKERKRKQKVFQVNKSEEDVEDLQKIRY